MDIIDTHQHLWDLKRFSYGWLKRAPVINRSFLLNDYQAAVEGLPIRKTVHVEADVDEPWMLEETKFILGLAERKDTLLEGVVACCRPEWPDFDLYMERIAGHPRLKGVRRILSRVDPRDWRLEQLRPYIRHVLACFGWERVLFGSDWPVCTLTASLHSWYETVFEITREDGPARQAKLFGGNAERVYGV